MKTLTAPLDLTAEAAAIARRRPDVIRTDAVSRSCPPHAALLHRIAAVMTTESLPPAHLSVNGRDVVIDCSGDPLVENAVRRWAAALDLLVTEVPVDGPAGVAATRWDASGWDGSNCWWHVFGVLPVAAVTS